MKGRLLKFAACISLGIVAIFGWIYKPHHHRGTEIKEHKKLDFNNIMIEDPKLIEAIIKVESNGNPKAVSHKGSFGLMQIHYASWKKQLRQFGIYNKNDLLDPDKNILAGKYVLAKHYEEEKGDLRRTLEKYSGGAIGYFEKVMGHYENNPAN